MLIAPAPSPVLRPLGPPRSSWSAVEGVPLPLGATWIEDEQAWNFALYAKHAERVTLLLYAANDLMHPVGSYDFDYHINKSGRVWHCRLPASAVDPAAYYAYRISGPAHDEEAMPEAYDVEKLLLDPYAREVFFPPLFDRAAASVPGSNDGKAPLAVLNHREPPYEWGDDRRPRHESDAVIYELHVRGFTRNPNSGIAAARRGTFGGVIDKIPYLKELGVTAVELMPVFQYDPQGKGRWGYTPLNFFAPHNEYAVRDGGADPRREFRDMVKALHAADIEVILDVVYNHTTEEGVTGPTYSFKGIDNSAYYLLTRDPARPYADYTGTGNTLYCANMAVRRMILDSMHAWAVDMRVDGFRFDLASVFGRRADGSLDLANAPVIGEISTHEDLRHLRLIAEPWDAAGSSALGRGFPGVSWQQWNARFRDDVRRFVRGDQGFVPALMQRLYGSDDLFPDDRTHAYRPPQSVNYVTCHDGFTLYDLVSYDYKRNWANGHDNRDGAAESYSWNCGWEGDEHVPPHVVVLRKQQAKNFFALLLLANGTPMVRAGDEFLQTQRGNDNPYNQDGEGTWLNWDLLDRNRDVFRFVKMAIAFRKAHPSLARSRFWRDDVRWYGTGAATDTSTPSHALAYCLHGASQGDVDLYVMINAWQEPLDFAIQEGAPGEWSRVIDTGLASPDDIRSPGDAVPLAAAIHRVQPRSVVVLRRLPAGSR